MQAELVLNNTVSVFEDKCSALDMKALQQVICVCLAMVRLIGMFICFITSLSRISVFSVFTKNGRNSQ